MRYWARIGVGLGLACWAACALAAETRPRLIDLGAKACIPCQLMAPVLDGMKAELAGKLDVEFVDVWQKENLPLAKQYQVQSIPTQVLLAPDGKELWRHEGFISRYGLLAKWRELGYDFATQALASPLQRYEPPTPPAGPVCFLCDGALPTVGTVTVPGEKGEVKLCGVHHFFVMLSCLEQGGAEAEQKALVVAADSGQPVALRQAQLLVGAEPATGRPWIVPYAERPAADQARAARGGTVLGYDIVKNLELVVRCGFCDRAMYRQDGASVKVAGIHSFGCCAHCAMGVAARTGANIEVHERDALTGEPIVITTYGGYIASVQPATAVAWFGKRPATGGKWASAGCFHQGFFATPEHLRQWLAQHPGERGEQISIDQSLADKLALTPQQIAKACKIGECTPR